MTRGLLGTLLTIAVVVAVGLLWGVSYERWGYFSGKACTSDYRTHWKIRIEAHRGLIVLAVRQVDLTPDEAQRVAASRRFWIAYRGHGRYPGDEECWMPRELFYDFRTIRSVQTGIVSMVAPQDYHLFSAPFWLVMSLCPTPLAIGAARLALSARRRRRRQMRGCCTHCGYDLRASTTRCPECGTMTDLARIFIPQHAPRNTSWITRRQRATPYVVRFIPHDAPLSAPAGRR